MTNKKLLSALTAGMVVATQFLSGMTSVSAAMGDPEFTSALSWMQTGGYTSAADETAFRPMDTLTREEGARFMSKFGTQVLCLSDVTTAMYADMADVDSTLSTFVAKVTTLGLMRGSNGMFMPKAQLTKAQLVASMMRGINGAMANENVTPRWTAYHTSAYNRGIIMSTTTVSDLARPVTRYEASLMLYRARMFNCSGAVASTGMMMTGTMMTGTMMTGTVPMVPAGTAMIKLSVDTPKGGVNNEINVAGNSSNNKVLKFDYVGGTNSTQLQTVTVKVDGLFTRMFINGLSLLDNNGIRVTNIRTINSSNEAILTFTTPTTVAAGQIASFYVLANFSGSTNERMNFSVVGATSLNGNITVNSNVVSVPVRTTQASNQTITFQSQNLTANPLSCPNGTIVYIGDMNKQLGRFMLSVSSSNNTNVIVDSIRLKSTQSIQGVINNLKLEVGSGGAIPATVTVNGKYVTFTFPAGYTLPYGTNRTFYIKGDVVGGNLNDRIEFYLDDAADVMAHEASTMALSLNSVANTVYSNLNCIKEGNNQISRTDTIGTMNIPTQEQMIFGLAGNINTKGAINTDRIRVYAKHTISTTLPSNGGSLTTDIENVRLYVNGVAVDTLSTPIACAGNPYVAVGAAGAAGSTSVGCYEFSYFNNLNAGVNNFEVRFDTKSTAKAGNRISFAVNSSSVAFNSNSEYNATNNTVNVADINGVAMGGVLIITAPSADNISLTDGYSMLSTAGTVMVRESADFTAMKFAVRANNVRDLILNGFTVDVLSSTLGGFVVGTNPGRATTAKLYVGGVLVQSQSLDSNYKANFNSLGIVIPKGSQKEIVVMIDTSATHPINLSNQTIQYKASMFDLDDINGNSVNSINGVATSSYTVPGHFLDVRGTITLKCNTINQIQSSVIPANSTTSVAVGNFEFKSQFGNATLTEIAFANVTTAGQVATNAALITSYTTNPLNATNFNASADGIYLEVYNGSMLVGNGQLINAIGYITLTNAVSLPMNQSVVLQVRARNANTFNGAQKTVRLRLLDPNSPVSAFNGGSAQTTVNANGSNATVAGTCTQPTANVQYLRATKISVADAVSPGNGLIATPNTKIYDGNITVDAAGSAALGKIILTVSNNSALVVAAANTAPFIDVNGSRYYDTVDYTSSFAGNSLTINFMAGTTFNANPMQLIPGSNNIKVYAALSGTPLVNQSITTQISNPSATIVAGTTFAGAPATASIVWNDNGDNGTANYTDNNWYTDAGVQVLPTNGYTIRN